jgi:hypothetical protein
MPFEMACAANGGCGSALEEVGEVKKPLIRISKEEVEAKDRRAMAACAAELINRLFGPRIAAEEQEAWLKDITLGLNDRRVQVRELGHLGYCERNGTFVFRLEFSGTPEQCTRRFDAWAKAFTRCFPGGRRPTYVRVEPRYKGATTGVPRT